MSDNRSLPPFLIEPEQIPRLVAESTSRFPLATKACVDRAEHAVRHEFVLQGNDPAGSYLYCGDRIDWHTSPNGDREGLFTLNRHRWFGDLARACLITGEERFARAFVEQATDWVHACPPPDDGRDHFHDFSPWKTLNGAIRMADYWIYAYHLLRGSTHLPAEFHRLFEESVYQHGEDLSRFIFDRTHNHVLKEMAGLVTIALTFPHFDRADEWYETAVRVLEEAVVAQTENDGTHYEATPGYHQHSLEWILLPMILLRRNGIEPPAAITERLRKMVDFAVAASLPDGSTVPFGDTDRNTSGRDVDDRAYIVGLSASLFDAGAYRRWTRPSFGLLWLVGESGREPPAAEPTPALPPRAFGDGGLFVLGSFEEELHVCVRNGPLRHGHPHADLLSFVLYAYGTLWLTDTGKYTYNEGPERKYLKGTRAHNTVTVDWEDQAPYRDRMSFSAIPEFRARRFVEGGRFTAYDGEHTGYRRLPMPVTHRRVAVQVGTTGLLIVDWLSGRGRHQFDQYFHVPLVDGVTCSPPVSRVDHGAHQLTLVQLDPSGLTATAEESWFSPAYGERRPSTRLRFTRVGDVPARFVTWIDVRERGDDAVNEVEVRLADDRETRASRSGGTRAGSGFLVGGEEEFGTRMDSTLVELTHSGGRELIAVSDDTIEVTRL
ncbi:MAG: alginate lyase family protein [bacterium]